MFDLVKIRDLTKKIGFARVLPGALNFGALYLSIQLLGTGKYGEFSITFGVISIVIQIIFGYLLHGLVPLINTDVNRQNVNGFALKFCLIFIVISMPLSFFLMWYDALYAMAVVLIAVYGADLTCLEIVRANSNFRLYGLIALTRSITLLVVIYLLWVVDLMTVNAFLGVYILGSAMSILVFLCVYRPYEIIRPYLETSPDFLHSLFHLGLKGTLLNLFDNLLPLIFKIFIQTNFGDVGAAHFSSSVDVAKRFVGVIFNLTSFVGLVKVYDHFRQRQSDEARKYQLFLFNYSMVAVLILVVTYALTFFTGYSINIYSFENQQILFSCITLAILVQRSRKILIDPLLIINSKGYDILVAGGFVSATTFFVMSIVNLGSIEAGAIGLLLTVAANLLLYGLIIRTRSRRYQ